MARYDAAWGSEERTEHEALIAETIRNHDGNALRAEAYRRGIEDAIQAHRPWAIDVLDVVLRNGFLNFWKRTSREGVVHIVTASGARKAKPRTMALSRISSGGAAYTQDVLIESFTREDLMLKRREILAMRESYNDTLRLIDGTLAFLDSAGTDDVATAEAILGMSLDSWLEGAA